MNYFVHLPLASISNALPMQNPTLILDYSHPVKAPPTTPIHFSSTMRMQHPFALVMKVHT